MRKAFRAILMVMFVSLSACGGGGDDGENCTVTYTTVAEMPIYIDYFADYWKSQSYAPLVRLNLGCDKWIEFELFSDGSGLNFQTESGESGQIYIGFPYVEGTTIAFADGYSFTYTSYADCTITTPSGETLRFLLGGNLVEFDYDSGDGTTFETIVYDSRPGGIILTVNGVGYGPLGHTLGYISNSDDITGDFTLGYSLEGGHKWGFDPSNIN